jgi:hypothetical protein
MFAAHKLAKKTLREQRDAEFAAKYTTARPRTTGGKICKGGGRKAEVAQDIKNERGTCVLCGKSVQVNRKNQPLIHHAIVGEYIT